MLSSSSEVKEYGKRKGLLHPLQQQRSGKIRQASQWDTPLQMQSVQKKFQMEYLSQGAKPETKQLIVKMSVNGSGIRDISRVLDNVLHKIKLMPCAAVRYT